MEAVINFVKKIRWVVITLLVIAALGVLFQFSATRSSGTMILLPFYLVSVFMLTSGAMSFWVFWKNRKNQPKEEESYHYE